MISEKKPDERSQNAVRGGKFGSAKGILSARSAERHPPAAANAGQRDCRRNNAPSAQRKPSAKEGACRAQTGKSRTDARPHSPPRTRKTSGEGRAENRGRSEGGAEPRGRSCRNEGPGRSSCAEKGQRDAEAIDEMGA